MTGTNTFGSALKRVLTEDSFKDTFYLENSQEVHTRKQIDVAVENLRKFIQKGDWTGNDFYRFIIFHLKSTAPEIIKMYPQKDLKEASVRTAKRRALEKLSGIIDIKYLQSLLGVAGADDLSVYCEQAEAIKFFDYLNKVHINASDFPVELLSKLGETYSGSKTYSVDECDKEIRFLSLFYLGELDSILNRLDSDKLGYVLDVLRKSNNTDNYGECFDFISVFNSRVNHLREVGVLNEK